MKTMRTPWATWNHDQHGIFFASGNDNVVTLAQNHNLEISKNMVTIIYGESVKLLKEPWSICDLRPKEIG